MADNVIQEVICILSVLCGKIFDNTSIYIRRIKWVRLLV